jgi:hypothetical protein
MDRIDRFMEDLERDQLRLRRDNEIAIQSDSELFMGGPMPSLAEDSPSGDKVPSGYNPDYTADMGAAWRIEGEQGVEAANRFRALKPLPLIEFDDGK